MKHEIPDLDNVMNNDEIKNVRTFDEILAQRLQARLSAIDSSHEQRALIAHHLDFKQPHNQQNEEIETKSK